MTTKATTKATPSFDIEKNLEDSLKEGLIITASTVGIFWLLKMAKVQPPKAALDAQDILKLTAGITAGALIKDYAYYKWMK